MLPQCNCPFNYLDSCRGMEYVLPCNLVNPFVSVGYSPYHQVLSLHIQNSV